MSTSPLYQSRFDSLKCCVVIPTYNNQLTLASVVQDVLVYTNNIIIVNDCIFVIEFKVGDDMYGKHAEIQVLDYSLDLRNFHEGSHHVKLIPVLISTKQNLVFLIKTR